MNYLTSLAADKVSFPKLGISLPVNDTAFSIFGLEIKWYGLIIAAGLFLAILYGLSQMKYYNIDPDKAIDVIIAGVIGAMVGARAYYVIMDWESYAGDWKAIFNLRNGGLAIYGGIIGAILAGGIVAKLRKLKFLPLLDILGIGLLLGQGIGRWGNFTNQEAFGYNTDGLFGMTSPTIRESIASAATDLGAPADIKAMNPDIPVHPCFLYESVWCLLGFVLFALFAKKLRRFDGQVFLMYLIWYGTERAFVEGLRTDSLMMGNIRVSQLLSVLLVLVSTILLIVMLNRSKRIGDS